MSNLPNDFAKSECLDCKGPVLTGTLSVGEGKTEFVIIHSGEGCPGFLKRFSEPGSTEAMNEKQQRVRKRGERSPLPQKTDK